VARAAYASRGHPSQNAMAGQVPIPLDLFARLRRAGLDVDAIIRRAKLLIAAAVLVPGGAARAAQASDHFDGRRFHNRAGAPEPTVREEAKVGWEMRTKKKNWPDHFETKRSEVSREPVLHGIRVLWFGHAGALIQTPSLNIITDPVLFDSIGPRPLSIKTVTNPGVAIESLPRIDLILISHNHYDHLDLRSLHALLDRQRDNPPKVLVGLGVGALLKKEGVPSYAEMDWGDSVAAKDARIFFLEAVHTSRRGPSDTNKTLWGSFLIDSPEGKIYVAGDTAYGKHFKAIFEKYGAPKLSLLPIGAYEPRWFMYRMHMNPSEAVRAHLDLHSQHSMAIHFGLIDNAGESYEAPATDLAAARKASGVDQATFVTPRLGQVFQY
jgi:L-ascorbate metabolism protein UlaG (beta-lactamase superfamily)